MSEAKRELAGQKQQADAALAFLVGMHQVSGDDPAPEPVLSQGERPAGFLLFREVLRRELPERLRDCLEPSAVRAAVQRAQQVVRDATYPRVSPTICPWRRR